MFQKIFNRGENWTEDAKMPIGKQKKWVIFLIIGAICFLMFDGFGNKDKKEEDATQKTENGGFNIETYAKMTEEKLETIISEVKGAGKVCVMVTFDAVNEKVIAKNNKNNLTTDIDGEKSKNISENEDSVLLYESGNEEKPFVLKEKLPVPSGVLVVASGAADENVRLEIYEAVRALYGISGHRIKVAKSEKINK